MKTYIFSNKYTSAVITISSHSLKEAEQELADLLSSSKVSHFRLESQENEE